MYRNNYYIFVHHALACFNSKHIPIRRNACVLIQKCIIMPTTPKGCKQFILQLSCKKDIFELQLFLTNNSDTFVMINITIIKENPEKLWFHDVYQIFTRGLICI